MRILCAHFPMHTANSKSARANTLHTARDSVDTAHVYCRTSSSTSYSCFNLSTLHTCTLPCIYSMCFGEHSTLLSEHCIVLGHIEATVKSHYCAHRLHRAHSAHRHSVLLNMEEVNKVNITHSAMHSGHCKS